MCFLCELCQMYGPNTIHHYRDICQHTQGPSYNWAMKKTLVVLGYVGHDILPNYCMWELFHKPWNKDPILKQPLIDFTLSSTKLFFFSIIFPNSQLWSSRKTTNTKQASTCSWCRPVPHQRPQIHETFLENSGNQAAWNAGWRRDMQGFRLHFEYPKVLGFCHPLKNESMTIT